MVEIDVRKYDERYWSLIVMGSGPFPNMVRYFLIDYDELIKLRRAIDMELTNYYLERPMNHD